MPHIICGETSSTTNIGYRGGLQPSLQVEGRTATKTYNDGQGNHHGRYRRWDL